jgi:uncharacterized membrane protein
MSTNRYFENSDDSLSNSLVLAFIVAVGFLLRFAWLDVPTLIRDEALVLMAAEHSPLYILYRALATDAHPPYFYYLAKVFLLFGKSDFALRFLSAASGTASIWCIYLFVRRLASRETALLAAAILACCFLHVQISRTVRPHPFIILLTTISFSWLVDFLKNPKRSALVRMALLNLLLLLFHFNALLVIGTQMALVSTQLPGKWTTSSRRPLLQFLGVSAGSLMINLPFFLFRLGKFPGFNLNLSMAWTFERTVVNLNKMMAIIPLEYASIAGWLLFAGGTVLLVRRNRFAALIILSAILLPLIVLILVKYGLFYEPWHISFILPFLITAMACALSRLLPTPLTARLVSFFIPIAAAAFIFSARSNQLYAMSSSIFGYEECHKKVALELPRNLGEPHAVLFNQIFELGFVNWYTRQFSSLDMTSNSITPGDTALDLAMVADGPIYSDENNQEAVAKLSAKLLDDLGPVVSSTDLGCSNIHRWRFKRSPNILLNNAEFKASFTAYAPEFFRRVHQARDVQVYLSPIGHSLYPSAYSRPASFTVRFLGATGHELTPADLDLDVFFSNDAPGNSFEISYSFDGGPAVKALREGNETGDLRRRILIKRPVPFGYLDVTCTMATSEDVPSFYGVSDSIRFNTMELSGRVLTADAFTSDVPVAARGLSDKESSAEDAYRWGVGPETELRFTLERPEPVTVELSLNNPIPGQGLIILANGAHLATLSSLEVQAWLAASTSTTLKFDGKAGENVVKIGYELWNGKYPNPHHANFAPSDGRPLAVAFTKLRVLAAGAAPAPLPVIAH